MSKTNVSMSALRKSDSIGGTSVVHLWLQKCQIVDTEADCLIQSCLLKMGDLVRTQPDDVLRYLERLWTGRIVFIIYHSDII